MKLAPAAIEHAEQIAILHANSWQATYADVLAPDYLAHTVPAERKAIWLQRLYKPRSNQVVLIAHASGRVHGFACAYVGEHAEWGSYLDNLHVDQASQRQGVGRRLLLEIARRCEEHNPGQGLYLLVNQTNQNAQNFYALHGAQNAQESVWNAPDGSTVPTFIYRWTNIATLAGA
ncbi:GNAT family N-acetyltransferase [Silvimonas amylolytica]|uniref:N-acetyltransferase domain-containing protein n=1 Tax=Silvimonas amylolytica TaxID=449663 RepID=A0ABQ2PPR9_9NEIS|nr:GNAT family N-acetyltransferase [Silvimonas amylolytica]GGP27613.1 hypothetical protein GCM10010971_34320 [Silvimonas amylolytica]